MLTENFAGKWPLWLSLRQFMVEPVTGVVYDYTQTVQKRLHVSGFLAEADLGSDTLNKKISKAKLSQCNYIRVVGAREQEVGSANVRYSDDVGAKASKTWSSQLAA
ncbi:threonyl-tRNA synthetase [Coemansia spiralis]|nr:threonyl-tRNA synthetase [Coemansia spiralis]